MTNETYIGRGDGGVPGRIFQNERFSGIVNGRSGCPLMVDSNPGSISIADLLPNSPCHYNAMLLNGVLTFDVITKGYRGSSFLKHPDLYFMLLFEATYQYFSARKRRIDIIHTDWGYDPEGVKTSDFYLECIGMINEDASPEKMTEAVRKTTPGKQFIRLGFNNVKNVSWDFFAGQEQIVADFER